MNPLLLSVLLLSGGPWQDTVKHPDCTNAWPKTMAYVHLKNAGLLTPEMTDFKKTTSIRLASQQIGPDLFHQVHLVTYTKNDGQVVQVVTVNDASSEECSMSGVEVFVVTKKLGGP